MDIDDGGPAFPVVCEQFDYGYERVMPKQVAPGISMRDYFAAKALAGLLADPNIKATRDEFAEEAYSMADAMLKARSQ